MMRFFVLFAAFVLLLADCGEVSSRVSVQCHVRGALPDPSCTPGAVFAGVPLSQLCVPGYTNSVRWVTQTEKEKVYAEYGVLSHKSGEYEIDHFVPLELAGSNDIANLWPEAANPKPGFHEKDQVENRLHALVCMAKMTLGDAQHRIATDWQKEM